MDEWVDMLLTEERVCDIILPRLTKRDVCETRDGLPPRISNLETSLLKAVRRGRQVAQYGGEKSGSDDSDGSDSSLADVKRWKLQRLQQSVRLSQGKKQSREEDVYDGAEEVYTSQEESDDEGGAAIKRRRFISPSPSVSPDRQLPTSPRPEAEEGEYVSRSPSRSPDREGYVSRSPSRSPDRLIAPAVDEEGQIGSDEGGYICYISRSPSRSPDRI